MEAPATVASASIGRRELLLWIVGCLFANQALLLLDVVSFDAFAASLLTQNDIYWLACAVTLYRLSLSDPVIRDSVSVIPANACAKLSSFDRGDTRTPTFPPAMSRLTCAISRR